MSLLFADNKSIFKKNGASALELNSRYIEKHIENLRRLNEKDEWKLKGKGALFMSAGGGERFEENENVCISGLCGINAQEFAYSVGAGETSGIFIKSLQDPNAPEKHVIHTAKERFGQIDYNIDEKLLVTSAAKKSLVSNIALFSFEDNSLKTITDGDSVDENPSFGACSPFIFYNSRGIGRNNNEQVMGFSNSCIYAIKFDASKIQEVLNIEGYDLVKPRETKDGSLYFIKKPQITNERGGISFSDILLAPFRIVKALFGWLNLKSMMYGGEALNSAGANPAKNKLKSKKELIVDGNIIDAERAIKENQKKGDKFAGYAPRKWELMRQA